MAALCTGRPYMAIISVRVVHDEQTEFVVEQMRAFLAGNIPLTIRSSEHLEIGVGMPKLRLYSKVSFPMLTLTIGPAILPFIISTRTNESATPVRSFVTSSVPVEKCSNEVNPDTQQVRTHNAYEAIPITY